MSNPEQSKTSTCKNAACRLRSSCTRFKEDGKILLDVMKHHCYVPGLKVEDEAQKLNDLLLKGC